MLFDWSTLKSTAKKTTTAGVKKLAVQWAAFYSDCEHEVYEVTNGHRLTLTYNLYVCRGQGHLAGSALVLDPTQLPLYGSLKDALATPAVLRRGQILGIWLNHSYAHTSKHLNFLPSSLKGSDMSLYETARAFNLECALVPIISLFSFYNGTTHLFTKNFYSFNKGRTGDYEHPTEGWGVTMSHSKIMWLNQQPGPKRSKKRNDEKSEAEKADDKARAAADVDEVQLSYMTYGNEPDIDIHYSRAAMFVRIPKFYDRGGAGKPKNSLLAAMRSRGDYYDEDSFDEDDYCDDYDEDEEEIEVEDEGSTGEDGEHGHGIREEE